MKLKMPSPVFYEAADRNKQPILEVFQRVLREKFGSLDKELDVLEVGSATGQHLAHFATHLPKLCFQPSDYTADLFNSINAFREQFKLSNLKEPTQLDLTQEISEWPEPSTYDILYCSNVIHISPWPCTLGLFAGAARVLKRGSGRLFLYGPFALDGVLSPESNVTFDRFLRGRNPEWGVRDSRELDRLATENGLAFEARYQMPANNHVLLYRKL